MNVELRRALLTEKHTLVSDCLDGYPGPVHLLNSLGRGSVAKHWVLQNSDVWWPDGGNWISKGDRRGRVRGVKNHDSMITEESDAKWSRRRRVTTEYHSLWQGSHLWFYWEMSWWVVWGKQTGGAGMLRGQWSGEKVRKVFLKKFKLEVIDHN